MATGDLINALNEDYSIYVTYENMIAGGTHDLNMGTNNDPSNANINLSVTSPGYTPLCATTTKVRSIVGVPCTYPDLGAMRKVYPNATDPDETVSGSDLIARYALSEFVYDSDTNVSLDIAGGTYNDGTNDNNNTTGYSVTNTATITYPKSIGNWALAQNRLNLGTICHVEFFAFHRSVENGKPVAAVRFTITDESLNSVSAIVNDVTISNDSPVGKIQVYQADIDVSTLTDGEILTIRAEVFPWVGNFSSILDTDDAVNSFPTPLYTNLKMRLDKTGTHGFTVVDPTNGNDGTGTVYSSQSAAEAGNAFQTHAAALTAMATYNNANAGHNDAGGGTLLLTEDTHSIDTSNGGTMDTYVIFKPVSTASKSNVLVNVANNLDVTPDKTKFEGVTITGTGFWSCSDVRTFWLYDCHVTATGATLFYRFPYGVAQNLTGNVPYEFNQYSTYVTNWALLRGNNMSTTHVSRGWTVLGNKNVTCGERSNTAIPLNDNLIYAYNINQDSSDVTTQITLAAAYDYTHGVAVIQNLFIRYGSQTTPLLRISADGTKTTTNHFCFCNNTIIGARGNFGYNDEATDGPFYQSNWLFKNNICFNWNNKDDTFASNPLNYGAWPVGYKVGFSGNHLATTASEEWLGEFKGIRSVWGSESTPLVVQFVDDQSADGGNTSGGDYHLTASSPCIGISLDKILPYDYEGNDRLGIDSPGAYVYYTIYDYVFNDIVTAAPVLQTTAINLIFGLLCESIIIQNPTLGIPIVATAITEFILQNIVTAAPVLQQMPFNFSTLPLIETASQLFLFLQVWIKKILNDIKGLNIYVLESHQNASKLKSRYITIDYSPAREKVGRAQKTEPAEAPVDSDELAEGTVFIIEDYIYTLNIREENGEGDLLKYIIDSIELYEIQQYFFDNRVSLLSVGNIQVVPHLDENEWIKQAVVEIRIGLPTYIETTGEGWIDSVDYTSNIT